MNGRHWPLMLFAAFAMVPYAAAADVERQRGLLDYGLWNHRVQTLYELGEEGLDALPLLVYSSDDADWQIRLTAVHFMGKIGPGAAAALGEIVRVEPCPRVRVSALRWLSAMGPGGQAILKEVMSPEDEREMESLPDRFGTERMGKPIVIDSPGGEMSPEFFDHGLDLRVCASSEYANRRKRGRVSDRERAFARAPVASSFRREEPPRPEAFEAVVTPSVRLTKDGAPIRSGERPTERLPDAPPAATVALIETQIPSPRLEKTERMASPESYGESSLPPDSGRSAALSKARPDAPPPAVAAPRSGPGSAVIRELKTPETLPPGGPGFEPREAAPATFRYGAAAQIRPLPSTAPRKPVPAGEIMPAAGPAIFHEPSLPGAAELVADAGTGKPENDPIPELIRRLSSSEPRTRARAADELGKRGKSALPAVPALRRALKDRDRRVRASAVLALGGVGASVDGVIGDLRRALRDKNEDVRFSAVIALERIK